MSELSLSPADLTKLADLVADRLAAKLAHADELIDCYEAARLLGISVPTLERRTADGSIPSIKIGRCRRYRRSELLNVGC